MWRAFFLAAGIALIIVGAESLAIEQAVLVPKNTPAAAAGSFTTTAVKSPVVVKPPEWAPWTFMSTGAVIVLYSFTIPRRVAAS